MEWEDRHLDGEGEEEGKRNPEESSGRKHAGGDVVLQVGEVEGAGLGVEPENGDEQGRRGNEGEEKKLERGARAFLAAVHGDEDRHGNERELPEAVVDEKIERDKDPEHGGLLHEEERVENLAAGLNRIPTGEDADGRKQAGEHDEPEAEAVDSDVVRDQGVGDPGDDLLELESGLAGGEVRGQMERENEGDECGDEREPVRELGAIGQQRDENGARQGNQEDEGEDGAIDRCHLSASMRLRS